MQRAHHAGAAVGCWGKGLHCTAGLCAAWLSHAVVKQLGATVSQSSAKLCTYDALLHSRIEIWLCRCAVGEPAAVRRRGERGAGYLTTVLPRYTPPT